MIRLFLVDDHAVLRQGLRTIFQADATLQVVGEAENGAHLLTQLPTTPCDVVLLDLNMPVLDGLATTRRLRAEFPAVRILLLSMVANEQTIGQVLAAGAGGYLLKSASQDEIVAAVRSVAANRPYLGSEIGLAMLAKVLASQAEPAPAPKGSAKLSTREREILRLIAQGMTTAQIADKLFISPRTIESHRQNIMEKVGATNTASLITSAISKGWLEIDSPSAERTIDKAPI